MEEFTLVEKVKQLLGEGCAFIIVKQYHLIAGGKVFGGYALKLKPFPDVVGAESVPSFGFGMAIAWSNVRVTGP